MTGRAEFVLPRQQEPRLRAARWLGAVAVVAALVAGTTTAAASPVTAAGSGYVNTDGTSLNVRGGPGTSYSTVGTLASGSRVDVYCVGYGTNVAGPSGWITLWNKISPTSERWVSDAFIYTGTNGPVAPLCSSGEGGTSPLNPFEYPWPTQDGWASDGYGYYQGECVSFVAWAVRSDGLPHNASPDWRGNANMWDDALGAPSNPVVDLVPHPGDIAFFDDYRNGAGAVGHVAYVAGVNADGTVKLYEYNWGNFHRLNIRTVSAGTPSRYLRF